MTSARELALTFECGTDTCLGILHAADQGAIRVGVLIVVGGPQYRAGSHRQFVFLARHLARCGYPVFRFDYRGMGDSTGEQRDFRAISDDIRGAIDAFVHSVPALQSIVIFGLCDAASAALMYCNADRRVAALILANPWVRTEAGLARTHVRHYYGARVLQGSFWRKLSSGRLPLLPTLRGFLRSVSVAVQGPVPGSDANPTGNFVTAMRLGLEKFAGPVLLVLSGYDLTAKEFTDLCGGDRTWARLLERQNLSVRQLADADHTFSSHDTGERLNALIGEWLQVAGGR
jgi:exosortase A-associated hydrolase 1